MRNVVFAGLALGLSAMQCHAEPSERVYSGNSAHFSFVPPENVTFTATSPTSVTRPESFGGAPEPANWALTILGFGAVGAVLRRGQRRNRLA